jgi:DNA polymerase-3 subunit chi
VTDVAFHFGAPDKIAYTCRLLRKAVNARATIEVVADQATLGQISSQLWALSAADFLPHCHASDTGALRELSAVILTEGLDDNVPTRQVLINLGSGVPTGYERFERLIEVVGTDEGDRALARERWKHYTQAGYTIVRHDLARRDVRV